MHICFICAGGFGHIEPYLEYFKLRGHKVSFISLSPAPDYGVLTYNVGLWGKYSRTEGKWKYPISMLRVRRLVRKLKPDIVNTHYVTSGGLAGLVCGFHPTMTTVHGSDLNLSLKSKVWRPLLKLIFNHADCVNACSKDLGEKVMGLGVSPEKIRVLTLGIYTDRFSFVQRQKRSQDQILRLVTTRRLEVIFDHSTIINALSILRSKGVNFQMTFVANGTLLEKLKGQVEQRGLADSVKFLGGVDKSEIVEILHKNDIFLSTPIYDGISIALLEAMSTGIFPIASDVKVNSDWIKHGVNGFLHKVSDSDSLANCILQFHNNQQIAATAAKLNRQKVLESGDTKTNMKLLEGIYKELIDKAYRGTS